MKSSQKVVRYIFDSEIFRVMKKRPVMASLKQVLTVIIKFLLYQNISLMPFSSRIGSNINPLLVKHFMN